MSRFLSKAMSALTPYTPGEQVSGGVIKLNTNESPYPPSPLTAQAISALSCERLRLYPNPDSTDIKQAAAEAYGLRPENIFCGGGSDECLAYYFMAFFERGDTVLFPDITYGFYAVYSELFRLNAKRIPLKDDFTIDVADYFDAEGNIVIANPNAPTGLCLKPAQLERVVRRNSDRLVLIDEAYVDFAPGSSCVELIKSCDNLLVVQTFSKSRGLAGMRLGLAFGCAELIEGLERVKYSFNPYNLDAVSGAVAIAALKDSAYVRETAGRIAETRRWTTEELQRLGYRVLPSAANFVFASPPTADGRAVYELLRRNGILVRYFPGARTGAFVRITIGTDAQMARLVEVLAAGEGDG